MTTIALLSLLAGIALGFRFKVIALFAACTVLLALFVGRWIAGAHDGTALALGAVASVVTLQIGYLAGAVLRHALPTADAGKQRVVSGQRPQSARPATH